MWEQYFITLLGFVEGEKLMGVEVFVSSKEETKFLGGRFNENEDVRLPGEISGDGATKHINGVLLLELRAEHMKRRSAF